MIPSATLIPTATPVHTEAVTPEEAEALARRIRVESKLPRLALVGTILGLVFGAAAVWPFLDSAGYMAEMLVRGNGSAVFGFFPGWILAGLLPLLAFYAGRLHFQAGKSSTRDLETSLRKIRRIIFWSMLAAAAAFMAVASERRTNRTSEMSWMPLLYAACFAACATIVGDVRRGLGDFDSEHQRRRRRLVRGFQVEVHPKTSSETQDDIPLATAVGTAAASSVPRPPPLPSAFPLDVEASDHDEHFKDLRLLLTLAVVAGICVHAVRIGELLGLSDDNIAGRAFRRLLFRSGSLSGPDLLLSLLLALKFAAVYILVPCGLFWILWGIGALNYGPGFRRMAIWLAAITLAFSTLVVVPSWILVTNRDSSFDNRLARGPEIFHCILIGVLLTRPGVKRLMSRASEADDGA